MPTDLIPFRISRVDLEQKVILNGLAFPSGRAAVWSAEPGRVTAALVTRGEHVRKGEALIELDRTKASRDLEMRRIGLMRARLEASRRRVQATKDQART